MLSIESQSPTLKHASENSFSPSSSQLAFRKRSLTGHYEHLGQWYQPEAEGVSKPKHTDLRLATSFSLLSSGTEANSPSSSKEKGTLFLRKDTQVLTLAILPSINSQRHYATKPCRVQKTYTLNLQSAYQEPLVNN